MAASMGPNFTGHPGGMGHPGVAGHSMGPGMPHNPGAHPGAPGAGMPHQFAGNHMAVSAPGGQVNPGMMTAMPPGANPQAHTMQHLNQQQMMQQQQFQNYQSNPAHVAAMRQQHQHLLQQQQRQAMMAQQFQHMQASGQMGQMPINMHLTPQQVQQINHLRSIGRIPPNHPQAIMAQQMMMQQQQQHQQAQQAQQAQQQQQAQQHQQQQAQQNQQAQQPQPQQQPQQPPGQPQPQPQAPPQQAQQPGQNPGQPMPMNAQNVQGMQQQGQPGGGSGPNQVPNQQGQQNQQQQGQPGQQGQQQAQSQAQSQAQAQAQGQGQGPQQQAGQQAQQTPQQTSQAGTPSATGQQTPTQTPAPNPVQQGQPPQAQNPQGPPQNRPQHPQHPQQPQMTAAQAQQLAFSNHLAMQQRREGMKGQCMLKLIQFGEYLTGYTGPQGRDDLSYWNHFVNQFFSINGVFRHTLHVADDKEPSDKQYEIAYPAIARYFYTHFTSGVKSIQLIMDKGISDRPLPGDYHCIESSKTNMVYWFDTGSHLVANGTLRAHFDAEQKIELFEFITTSHDEFVSRKSVIDAAKPAHMWIKEWRQTNSDSKQSPELSKKGKGRQLKSPQTHPPDVLVDLPESVINSNGVTKAVDQFLEIVEVIGQMTPLFNYYTHNLNLSPYNALEKYVDTQIPNAGAPGPGPGPGPGQGPGPAMNGQPMPQNPRTPSFSQFQMGASPAAVHMNLPGSPHLGGSPAPGQMQAPPMQIQQSQQGTSSSGPSANTSPASNKRRRPSGVKTEDDGSGAPTPAAQVNGIQNRPQKPATPRMAKRVKGNPS